MRVQDLDLGGVRPLNHEFARGRITVVLGRNRSGKSRLARMLAGLETTDPGTVFLGDVDVSQLDAAERRVALVYQAFVNYPNLTVAENIASPLRARKMAAAGQRERVAELAERLRIDELLDRYPHELSGGQQQRVAIARALAQEGELLVMDEPLVNLDYKLREELEGELRALLSASQLTVVYNTSDPRDAFKLGDEVVLLHEHEILQTGAPLDVYRAPASLAAAAMMSDPAVNVWHEDGVARAVRPEHLRLEASGSARRFEVRVADAETSGSETFVHCEHAGAAWVARLTGMHDLQAGQVLDLWADAADLMAFPPASAPRAGAQG